MRRSTTKRTGDLIKVAGCEEHETSRCGDTYLMSSSGRLSAEVMTMMTATQFHVHKIK